MHLRFIFEALSDLNAPGEYMRYYRQLRGLTTRQLAEKLNIVPATVLGYEQGRFPIPYDIAVLLAEELQISESLLFDDFCVFIGAPYTEVLHTIRTRYGLNHLVDRKKHIFPVVRKCGFYRIAVLRNGMRHTACRVP